MKVTTTKQVEEIIDINFPYYYKHDLSRSVHENIIYGKIEENLHITIHRNEHYGTISFKVEKEIIFDFSKHGLNGYFEKEHLSNKEEFELISKECLLFVNQTIQQATG